MGATGTRRILVVDDEPTVCALLTQAITRMVPGCEVTTFESAEDAAPSLQKDGEWDLLIVDKNLPGMSGFDLVAAVRAKGLRLPVILVTAYFTPETRKLAHSLRIVECFSKPFPLREMLDAVRKALDVGPAAAAPAPILSEEPSTRRHAATPKGPAAKILVVDDDPSVAVFLERALSDDGHQIVVVRDASEALRVVDAISPRPDLALVDVNLPVIGGLELTRLLKAKDPSLRVLLMTVTPEVVDAAKVGAVGCLEKPFRSLPVLLATIRGHALPGAGSSGR